VHVDRKIVGFEHVIARVSLSISSLFEEIVHPIDNLLVFWSISVLVKDWGIKRLSQSTVLDSSSPTRILLSNISFLYTISESIQNPINENEVPRRHRHCSQVSYKHFSGRHSQPANKELKAFASPVSLY
jgi:hypothetical protein